MENNIIPFQVPALSLTKGTQETTTLTIAQCKVQFLNYKLKVKKLSPKSVKVYEGEINRLISVLPDGPLTLIRDITEDMLESYIAYANMEKRKWEDHPFNANAAVTQIGLKGRTVNNMRRYLSSFFNWLLSKRMISENPVANIEKVTEDEVGYGAILELFEVQQLLDQINRTTKLTTEGRDRDRFNAYVDATMIQVLVDTAMRIGQALQLRVDDLMLEQGLIHIRPEITKNHQERWVPITEGTAHMLKTVVQVIQEATEEGVPWLWLTSEGTQLCYSTFVDRLKHYAKLAGLDARRVRPHQFRHFSAIEHRKRGARVDEIQALLEHKSIATTMIYLSRFKHDMRSINDRYSPAHDLFQKPGRKSGHRKLVLPADVEVFSPSTAI